MTSKERDDRRVSTSDVKAVLNPVAGAALLGACMFNGGVLWVAWAFVIMLASYAIGSYVEAKINEYDSVIRRKAEDVTGEKQPGTAEQLGVLVRYSNLFLGVFCPAVPLVSLAAGMYIGRRAKRLAKVDTSKAKASLRNAGRH